MEEEEEEKEVRRGWGCRVSSHRHPPSERHRHFLETRAARIGHPDPRPAPSPAPSLIYFPPIPLSVQVAERTPAVGCSLSSPTHGQRSSELPQRATAPVAEGGTGERRGHSRFPSCFGTSHTRIYLPPPLSFWFVLRVREGSCVPCATMLIISSRSALLSVYYPQIFLILTSGSYLYVSRLCSRSFSGAVCDISME